jgi:hypothetical protein
MGMREVVLKYRKPTEILDIVREMRESGLIQGKDFDFKYNQTKWNDWSNEAIAPEHTVFIFYTETLASWFSLKYE